MVIYANFISTIQRYGINIVKDFNVWGILEVIRISIIQNGNKKNF